MGLFDNWFGKSQKEHQLDEAMKAFDKKYLENKTEKHQGEGISDFNVTGYGTNGLTSFNNFYNKFINIQYQNEVRRILDYRNMAQMPEISDVIEDAVIESTQEDEEDGNVIKLNIIDDNIAKNKNIVKNLTDEFNDLFFNRIKVQDVLFDWMQSYYIDGRFYYEKILNPSNHKQGILGVKQLPSEMMDYQINPLNGDVLFFVQNLSDKPKIFTSIEEAERDKSTIAFYPNQIGFINYGRFGSNKKQILGYLEKCKQPFNQLKLLETSVVIYRFIRSPERLVFKIDTGAMPLEKAMKFVQKVKEKMNQQVDFDPESGEINNKSKILSILSNFWLPQCLRMNTKIPLLDGRTLELKDLIKEYGEGKKNYTYSIDQSTGKIIKGEIEWAGITRKDAELVRVHIDNHEYVDVTPDHKFVMRNGTEVMAQDLKEGDSLMSLYTETERINKSKSNRNIITHMGYDSYTDMKENFVINHKVTKIEKLNIREDTGCLTIKDPGNNHNFAIGCGIFVKNSSDGRGSDVTSISGNPSGFAELDDLYYFQKKLYRSLKYPMSRVSSMKDGGERDILFGGNNTSEITRDEIKWSVFLEKHQNKFANSFQDLFLLHLFYRGYKKQYSLDDNSFRIEFNAPNKYKAQLHQSVLETRSSNYSSLSNSSEFSKSYLMKKYLRWSDEDIILNSEGFKEDKKLGFKEEGF